MSVRLISIHGVGDQAPGYAEPFATALEAAIGESVDLHAVWWADLSQYRGLGTPVASAVDAVLDPLRYAWSFAERRRLRTRLTLALFGSCPHPPPERTILVTHSWGGVIAYNMLPDDQVALWVSFHTRRYLATRFGAPPKVGRWVNVWSPRDPLSEQIERAENIQTGEGHGPMWTSGARAMLVARLWKERQ